MRESVRRTSILLASLAALAVGLVACASGAVPSATSAPVASATPSSSQAPTGPSLTPVPGVSAAPTFSLTVTNIDGPPVDVLVGGTKVVSVTCDPASEREIQPTVSPGVPLPWQVEVVHAGSGAALASFTEDGASGPMVILVRSDAITHVPLFSNPGPAPAPSCAP